MSQDTVKICKVKLGKPPVIRQRFPLQNVHAIWYEMLVLMKIDLS